MRSAQATRWSFSTLLNIGLLALCFALVYKLVKARPTKPEKVEPPAFKPTNAHPAHAHSEGVQTEQTHQPAHDTHAFMQSPPEQSIVMNISDFADDPGFSIFEAELSPVPHRHRHHHHY